jgi:Tfp pilus assembly protein FimV
MRFLTDFVHARNVIQPAIMKKNLRYLTSTFAATAFLATTSSYALGIGDIKLQSALNQNLKAQISLILSDDEKAADLKIGLAPITKFDDAGIPWTVFLSKIKFQTVTENGNTFIKLSSIEALKEPFLDFIIEIRSSKSNLYREFTVLVDPPESYQLLEKSVPKKENVPTRTRLITAPIEKPKNTLVKEKQKAVIARPKTIIKQVIKPKIVQKTISPAPEISQKMVELEKQISEMKQALANQNAQIAALKTPIVTSPMIQPESQNVPAVITPESVVKSEPVTPAVVPTLPIMETKIAAPVTPIISTIPPTVVSPTLTTPVVTAPPVPDLITEVLNSLSTIYLSIPAESYNYVAAATSSLLLSVLGFLRLRNRRKTEKTEDDNRIEPEITTDNVQSNETLQSASAMNETLDKMFANETADTELETFDTSLPEFTTLMNSEDEGKSNKQNANDVLYRVDVYCAYGNFDHAILLLNDEFSKHPDVNEYALRLLNLYVLRDKKDEFKAFVIHLMQQGKNENTDFWKNVTDLVAEFYPDALLENSHVLMNESFAETEDKLAIFEQPEPFIFDNSENFDIAEEPSFALNSDFDLDFTAFKTEENDVTEEPKFLLDSDSNFDLDFTTFKTEKTETTEEPKFLLDSEFDLDFTTFKIEKTDATEKPKFLLDSEFDLDFIEFDTEKKTPIEFSKS